MEWYVARNGQTSGPFSFDALVDAAKQRQLDKEDLVWREGMPTWVPAGTVNGIFSPPPLPSTQGLTPSTTMTPPEIGAQLQPANNELETTPPSTVSISNASTSRSTASVVVGGIGLMVAILLGKVFGIGLSELVFGNKEGRRAGVNLSGLSNQLNRGLPMMIDSDTRLDGVAGLGMILIYKYTLVNVDVNEVDKVEFLSTVGPKVTNGVCTNPGMRADFLEKNIKVKYVYYDKIGKHIAEIPVTLSSCP